MSVAGQSGLWRNFLTPTPASGHTPRNANSFSECEPTRVTLKKSELLGEFCAKRPKAWYVGLEALGRPLRSPAEGEAEGHELIIADRVAFR